MFATDAWALTDCLVPSPLYDTIRNTLSKIIGRRSGDARCHLKDLYLYAKEIRNHVNNLRLHLHDER